MCLWMYLPFFVTIISFVMHWNLVQSSRSSNDKDSGNPWFPVIAAGGPRVCLVIAPRSSRSSRFSSGLVRLCLPRSRSRFRSCSRSLSRSRSRSWHEERVGEPGVRGALADCIFSVLRSFASLFRSLRSNLENPIKAFRIPNVYSKGKRESEPRYNVFFK